MSQKGVVESLPPRVGPEPWPQPGDGRNTPMYPRQLSMVLLYEAQQKDPFIRHLIQPPLPKLYMRLWPPTFYIPKG